MWLTDLMEIQFAGAMLSLLVDLGRKYYGRSRARIVGAVAVLTLLLSLADLLANWSQMVRGPVVLQPVESILASLYSVDRLGALVIFTILVVGLAVAAHSAASLAEDDNAGPFFALLVLLVTSTIGVVSAGDFLTLFLFWEVMSISAYGLVAFRKSDLSLEAAMKYLFLAGSGSLLFLYGVALVYSVEGSIRLDSLSLLMQQNSQLGLFAMLMIVVGIGVEAAVFPVHTWLPDAYGAAPVPVSAFLGGAVTETAVFAILKLLQPLIPASAGSAASSTVHGLQVTLVAVSVLTMLVGNLGALGQSNVRRMLAFSSVAQVGYMLAALSTFTSLGLVAVVFHIWNHGLVKSNFFMLTGAGRGAGGGGYEQADLEDMRGIGQRNKVLGVLFTMSSLAMVGSPPFGMFWSELLIVSSILSVGSALFFGLAVTLVLNVFLSIGYYFRVINAVALSSGEAGKGLSPGWGLVLSPAVLILLSLVTGILPSVILGLIA